MLKIACRLAEIFSLVAPIRGVAIWLGGWRAPVGPGSCSDKFLGKEATVPVPSTSQTVFSKNAPSVPAQMAGHRGGNAWPAGWALAAIDGAIQVRHVGPLGARVERHLLQS